MTFDELLKSKLAEIQGVKIYPLVVPKGTPPPYAVYQKGPITYKRTLSGDYVGADGEYNIALIATTYDNLQSNEVAAIDKLTALKNAEFGEHVVDDAVVQVQGNFYIEQSDEYRSDLKLTFSY